MKSLLIVYSYHHNNTEKVAKIFAKVLDAQIQSPLQMEVEEIQKYDLVGFGAGIDSGKHYKPLLNFAEKLPQVVNKKAFIFSTAGITEKKNLLRTTQILEEI